MRRKKPYSYPDAGMPDRGSASSHVGGSSKPPKAPSYPDAGSGARGSASTHVGGSSPAPAPSYPDAGMPARGSATPKPSPKPTVSPVSTGLTAYAQEVLGLTTDEAEIVPYAVTAGEKYGVSPALLMGVMENQSGLKPDARIGEESGLGMFGKKSAEQYGVKEGDIESQVNGLAEMLKDAGVNEDPRRTLNMWARGEHRNFADRVIQTAEHYEGLESGGAKPSQPASGPVNTERPMNNRRAPMDAGGDREGPVNTERPAPPDPSQKMLDIVAKGTEILKQGAGPTPEQKARVRRRLEKAVDKSGAQFLDDTLTPDQQEFAKVMAEELGVGVGLTAAAVLREGGNGTPGDNNWTNIGWFDSGPQPGIADDPRWRDPVSAAKLTAAFIMGEEFGPSESIANIGKVAAAGGSDEEVAAAWAASDWASAGASPQDVLGDVPIKEGGDIPQSLKARAREVLGKLNTQAIINDVDVSSVRKIPDAGLRNSAKRVMVTGKVTKQDAQALGAQAAEYLADGGKIVKAKDGAKRQLSIAEMFYDPGVSLDTGSGTLAETSPIGGHSDHVHVSSEDPWSMLMVIQKARELGMLGEGQGENPAIDTIDASHSPDGYHYREEPLEGGAAVRLAKKMGIKSDIIGQGVDIAGTPEQMAAMNQWVLKNAGKEVDLAKPIKGTDLAVEPPPDPAPDATAPVGGSTTGVPVSGSQGLPAPVTSTAPKWQQRNFKKNGSALPVSAGISPGSADAIFGNSFAGMNPDLLPQLAGVLPPAQEEESMTDLLREYSKPRRRINPR